jgi:hypothetical protein
MAQMLRDRIKKAADRIGGVDALVEKSVLKRRTLYDYISGKTEPKISAIADIAKHTGVNIGWLVTGDGDMIKESAQASVVRFCAQTAINAEVFKQVGKLVASVYSDEGVKLPPEALMAEAASHYNALMGRADQHDDVQELLSLLPWLENKVRKDIRNAAKEPGTGKHSA